MINTESVQLDDLIYDQVNLISEIEKVSKKMLAVDENIINSQKISSYLSSELTDFAFLNDKTRKLAEAILVDCALKVFEKKIKSIDSRISFLELIDIYSNLIENRLDDIIKKILGSKAFVLLDNKKLQKDLRFKIEDISLKFIFILEKTLETKIKQDLIQIVPSEYLKSNNLLKNISNGGDISGLVIRILFTSKSIMEIISKTKKEEKDVVEVLNQSQDFFRKQHNLFMPNNYFLNLMNEISKNFILHTVFKSLNFYLMKTEKNQIQQEMQNLELNLQTNFKNLSVSSMGNYYRNKLNKNLFHFVNFIKKYESEEKNIETNFINQLKECAENLNNLLMDSCSFSSKENKNKPKIVSDIKDIVGNI
jgi:hypothetical protein